MPETADPVAALVARDIPTRAAGCRDLAVAGGPEHIARLVTMGATDPSPGVRLNAAAAAADILSRYRLPPRHDVIDAAAREGLLVAASRVEPGVNPGLFQVVGEVRLRAGVQRMLAALRDPRLDVRVGACVGLLRLCASAASNGDAELERSLVGALSDTRIRVETRAELARLCANVGFSSALEPARALAPGVERNAAEVVGEAVRRLASPPSRAGVWVDLGTDALAVDARAERPAYVVFVADGEAFEVGTEVRSLGLGREVPIRLCFLKRDGATPPGPALQVRERTLWAATAEEIADVAERLLELEAWDVVPSVAPLLPPTAATLRLVGAARLRSGDAVGALEALSVAVELKKVPGDAWWWLAEALTALGRADEARPHLERFVQKSVKRAPYVAEARRRLDPSAT